MNLNEKKDVLIFINMYVHYQEAYNANTISNSFNNYYFEHKLLNSLDNPKCYVMINSAPHSEEESIKIEISLNQNDFEKLEKEMVILNIKEFVKTYFKGQIKVIEVLFIA